tara:strand:- start:2316 stop:3344 length:1029 start_codon:yes stop_codon:yes gene_type:complete
MSPKSIKVDLNFENTVNYIRHWIENNTDSLHEQTIQNGVQYRFGTAHGERKINVYDSKTKPGTRIVFNDPIFEGSERIATDLNRKFGEQTISTKAEKKKTAAEPNSLLKYKNLARIGSDESGKGDYFGPIIICAVLFEDKTEIEVEKILNTNSFGIRDSKQFTDIQNRNLAQGIKNILPDFEIFKYSAFDYNKLHDRKTSNLNALIGLGHSAAIQNLLARKSKKTNLLEMKSLTAIVDQFDRKTMPGLHKLKEKYPLFSQIQFMQAPKADANDLAVASASIIARAIWLEELEILSDEIGFNIAKGAGPKVDKDARKILSDHGVEWLQRNAKFDFKNTTRIVQ